MTLLGYPPNGAAVFLLVSLQSQLQEGCQAGRWFASWLPFKTGYQVVCLFPFKTNRPDTPWPCSFWGGYEVQVAPSRAARPAASSWGAEPQRPQSSSVAPLGFSLSHVDAGGWGRLNTWEISGSVFKCVKLCALGNPNQNNNQQ